MGPRSGSGGGRLTARRRTRVLTIAVVTALLAPAVASRAQAPPTARVSARLEALRREAADLAKQGSSLLGELRRLELERQMRIEELAGIEQELLDTSERLAASEARAAQLDADVETLRPDLEARLVRLYKLGPAGYWRLLLDVDDVRAMGRAYRIAATLTRSDRVLASRHASTVASLEAERDALRTRVAELDRLKTEAGAARASLDAAASAAAARMQAIESRRDLAAQLAGELDAAYLRLQATVAQSPGAGATGVPLRPFRGAMPWPASGIVISRFGRQRVGRMAGIETVRHGIELSLAEGGPVHAVHDGVVAHAGPHDGYGQLVILDHGAGAASLYGHLAAANVNKGDRVTAGTRLGSSGRNTAGNPALYFELRVDGKPVDPLQWLQK